MRQGSYVGHYLGSYQLEQLIGQGGMGEVWRASSPSDHTQVAIKVLREDLKSSQSARESFRKEAELTQRLRSPQSIKVINYSVATEEVPYIVMEYLDGEDLQKKLDREGSLPLMSALLIAMEVLKALSELHQAGYVHRDIKPSNIFILKHQKSNEHIQIKILDFGLALASHETPENGLRGSYLFMAPEQIKKQAVSPATDLYGVAALLFMMVTGSPPFKPTGADQIFAQLEQDIPTLSKRVPHISIPNALDQLLTRCLAKEASSRPDNADVLRRALAYIVNEVKRPREGLVNGLLAAEDEVVSRTPLPYRPLSDRAQSIRPHYFSNHPKTLGQSALSYPPTPSPTHHTNLPSKAWDEVWTLSEFLQERGEQLLKIWLQSISEYPQYSRIQQHHLRSSLRAHLNVFLQLAHGRPRTISKQLIDQTLQQTFTRPSAEYAPLLTLSLLSKSLDDVFPYEWSQEQSNKIRHELLRILYLFRAQFIETITTRRYHDANQFLYQFFLQSSELAMMCTPNGITLNTHAKLRSAFNKREDDSLTSRQIFDILKGYQPILPLQKAFEFLHQQSFQNYFILENPTPKGYAVKLQMSPYLVGRSDQPQVLILINILSEQTQRVEVPELQSIDSDFASPQALPWMMTTELPSITASDIRAYINAHSNPPSTQKNQGLPITEQAQLAYNHQAHLNHSEQENPQSNTTATPIRLNKNQVKSPGTTGSHVVQRSHVSQAPKSSHNILSHPSNVVHHASKQPYAKNSHFSKQPTQAVNRGTQPPQVSTYASPSQQPMRIPTSAYKAHKISRPHQHVSHDLGYNSHLAPDAREYSNPPLQEGHAIQFNFHNRSREPYSLQENHTPTFKVTTHTNIESFNTSSKSKPSINPNSIIIKEKSHAMHSETLLKAEYPNPKGIQQNSATHRVTPPPFTPPQTNHSKVMPVVKSTRHSRIQSVEPQTYKSTPHNFLIQVLVFIICILLLWNFRAPIKSMIHGRQTSHQSVPSSIYLKVNSKKARFIHLTTDKIICQDTNYCEVGNQEEIKIESDGYYPRYLRPEELKERNGSIWKLILEKRGSP